MVMLPCSLKENIESLRFSTKTFVILLIFGLKKSHVSLSDYLCVQRYCHYLQYFPSEFATSHDI